MTTTTKTQLAIENAMRNFTRKTLGVEWNISTKRLAETNTGSFGQMGLGDEWWCVAIEDLERDQLGAFAPAIARMRVRVSAAAATDTGYLKFAYSYDHTGGGSNGYTVRMEFSLRDENSDPEDIDSWYISLSAP